MPAQYPGNSVTKAARAKAGGGYESAIEVVSGTPAISSVTDNGDGTLTIVGSGFGTKDQPTEILYDGVDFVRENGVENSHRAGLADGATILRQDSEPDEVYRGGLTQTILAKTGLRGEHCTAKYQPVPGLLPSNVVWVGSPKAEIPDGNIAYHPRYHCRFFIKWHYPFSKLKTLRNWTVTSGEFIYPDLTADPKALGEEVQLGDSGIQGFLIRTDGEKTSVYTPNNSVQFEVEDGTVITGLTSGATATISSSTVGTDNYGPEKVFRAYSQQSGDGDRLTIQQYDFYLSSLSTSEYKFKETPWFTVFRDITEEFEGQWVAVDLVVDFESDYIKLFADGRLVGELSQLNNDLNNGLYTAAIGWQDVRSIYNFVEFADIYVDHELKCVYLGNAATWEDCTVTEIQPLSWQGDSTVEIPKVRYGALDLQSPIYVFLTDSGVPNSDSAGHLTGLGG